MKTLHCYTLGGEGGREGGREGGTDGQLGVVQVVVIPLHYGGREE